MHKTVLLNEAIDNLNVKEDGIYVDATLGFGGHSGLILKRVKRGFLFAFDQDEMAIEYSDKKLSEIGNNYEIIKSNFVNLKEELNKRLEKFANDNAIAFINLNKIFAENKVLKKEFTSDDLHLNGSAYQLWSKEIRKYLN